MAPYDLGNGMVIFDDTIQSDQDDATIRQLLSETVEGNGDTGLLDLNRPLELGEKAEDAED